MPAASPSAPEPQVVTVQLPPTPIKNPWPTVVLLCVAMVSMSTCSVALVRSAPATPEITAPKPAPHPSPKRHRKAAHTAPRAYYLEPSTVRPGSVVDLGSHNSADTHESVNGKH